MVISIDLVFIFLRAPAAFLAGRNKWYGNKSWKSIVRNRNLNIQIRQNAIFTVKLI